MLIVTGDVLAAGAEAVGGGRDDYTAFWPYVLTIAAEIGDNGLVCDGDALVHRIR